MYEKPRSTNLNTVLKLFDENNFKRNICTLKKMLAKIHFEILQAGTIVHKTKIYKNSVEVKADNYALRLG